jgi:hypothetical protein
VLASGAARVNDGETNFDAPIVLCRVRLCCAGMHECRVRRMRKSGRTVTSMSGGSVRKRTLRVAMKPGCGNSSNYFSIQRFSE